MKRVAVIAGVLLLGALANAPARADFSVLIWKNSLMCQIWDNAAGYAPAPAGEYVIVARTPYWNQAVDALNNMAWSHRCW